MNSAPFPRRECGRSCGRGFSPLTETGGLGIVASPVFKSSVHIVKREGDPVRRFPEARRPFLRRGTAKVAKPENGRGAGLRAAPEVVRKTMASGKPVRTRKASGGSPEPRFKSLHSALELLLRFSNDHPEWHLSQLARELKMNKSKVHRILKGYQEFGIVEQEPVHHRYRLGLRLFELGSLVASRMDLRTAAQPHLVSLISRTRGTARLRILDGCDMITLSEVESPETLRVSFPVGLRLPVSLGACGKILLAFAPPETLRAVLADPARSRIPKTFLHSPRLPRALEEIRRKGYSVNDEERVVGVRSVGAPVRDRSGRVVAAVGLSLPTVQLPRQRVPEIASSVCEAAGRISRDLGCSFEEAARRDA